MDCYDLEKLDLGSQRYLVIKGNLKKKISKYVKARRMQML